jgi:hypothetical protein
MKESYMKGIATHHGPESCLDLQQWGGEALTGEHTGRKLNSEITSIRRLTLFNEGENNIRRTIKARCDRLRRIPRQVGTMHVKKLFARESGDPVSSLPGGKRKQGGIDEGENPKNRC